MANDIPFEPVRSVVLDLGSTAVERRRPPRPVSTRVALAPDPFPADSLRTRWAAAALAVVVVGVLAVVVPLVTSRGHHGSRSAATHTGTGLPAFPLAYSSPSAPVPTVVPVPRPVPSPHLPPPAPVPTPRPSAPSPHGSRAPAVSRAPSVKPSPSAKPVTSYHAIAGPDCPAAPSIGFRYEGWYTNGRLGWVTDTAGSWTGNGCTGAWAAMPMSGSDTPTAGVDTQWWFVTGFASGTCAVDVYIPKGTRSWDSWGDPAYYQVLRSRAHPSVLATFTVGQKWGADWASVGTFAITDGELFIKLLNRGTNNPDGQKLALGPIRVTCTA